MKTNKTSLLILIAALTGCGGGSSPNVAMPMGATYTNVGGNQGGGVVNPGENTQTEPKEVELTEVVGSLDDAINEVYGYFAGKNPSTTTLVSFGVSEINDRYDYNGSSYDLTNSQVSPSEDIYRASQYDGDDIVITEKINEEYYDEEGNFEYTNESSNDKYYPTSLKFSKNDNGEIASLCTSNGQYCANNAMQNSDGSFSAILANKYGKGDNIEAYKVTFGSELSNIKPGEESNEHQDYTIWQVGKVDSEGNFTPTQNGAYANLHINRNNYETFYMQDGWMGGSIGSPATDKPNDKITFEGKTNAVKVSTEKPNENLTGDAKLVVDFQRNYYDPTTTLTLDFYNWKKIDIESSLHGEGGPGVRVNGEYTGASATTTIGFTKSGSHMDESGLIQASEGNNVNEYNKATGIYRIEDVTDNDGTNVDVIGGFDARAKDKPLSIGEDSNFCRNGC